MADVAHGRKQNPILLIGVVGVALALLALVWLLGRIGERPGDPAPSALDANAAPPAATTSGIGADASRAAHTGSDDTRSVRTSSEDRSALLAGPVHGRVVDQRTQEPVPFVDVHFSCGVLDETIQTGRDGAFQSTQAFTGDRLTAIVSDGGFALETLVRDKGARADEPWILEVPIGPTYPLAINFNAPIDPAQWTARVLESTRNFENAGEIDVDERGLTMSAPLADAEDRVWPWITLRAEPIFSGDILWVRYPSIHFKPDPRYRLRIELGSEALGRKGIGRIRSTLGVQDPVIFDRLESVGTLAGKLVDERDVALGGATVLLQSPGSGRPPEWRVTRTNEKGEWRFSDLSAGDRDLVAFAPREPVLVRRKLHVPIGGVTVLEESLRLPNKGIDLDPDAIAGRDAGSRQKEIAAKARLSGRETFFAHIRLRETDRHVSDWLEPVSDVLIRERQARFQSARLPDAELQVEWLDLLDSFERVRPPVAPTTMSISDPRASLKIEYGGRDGRELHFAVEGEDERTASCDLSFEPGGALIGEQSSIELRRWLLSRGTHVRWAAWRRGCAPVFGYQDAFKEEKRRDLTARIRFTPGWGAVLWCRATNGTTEKKQRVLRELGYAGDDSGTIPPLHEVLASPPLSGVRLMVDGTLAETSDDEGVLWLSQKSMPAHLVLIADNWHMVKLERLPQRCAATLRYIVWMDRE